MARARRRRDRRRAVAGRARPARLAQQIGLVVSVAVLGWSIAMAVTFDAHTASRFDLTESHSWIPAIGARYELGLDGIGLVLVLLTTALLPLLLLAGWRRTGADPDGDSDDGGADPSIYVALTLAVQAMVLLELRRHRHPALLHRVRGDAHPDVLPHRRMGSARPGSARPRSPEVLAVQPLRRSHHARRRHRLYVLTARAKIGVDGHGSFGLVEITKAIADGKIDVSGTAGIAICGAFLFAFAVKAPVWPLHAWLPDAAVAGTPSTGVLMMAVMDKVGTFAMLRFVIELFGDTARSSRRG